jgi:hypothetical protein
MEMHFFHLKLLQSKHYFIFRHHKKTGINLGENTKGANIVLKVPHNGFFSHSPKGPKG